MRVVVCAVAVVIVGTGFAARAQIENVTPVTDAVLQNPDPADWVNWRRTLDGWGYSPLDQINRDNVQALSLAWVWSMPDGTNQPTPLVRDGVLYLANPGNLKVGIPRHVTDGISSRWIDQGASQATVMLRVPDRLTSGKVEQLCTQYIGDKTNWRTMLKGQPEQQDLIALKHQMLEKLTDDLAQITADKGIQAVTTVDDVSHEIGYPVDEYPVKIKSINLDKTPEFSGVLTGIKGQYWMLDGDRVINIRKYAGYEVDFSAD